MVDRLFHFKYSLTSMLQKVARSVETVVHNHMSVWLYTSSLTKYNKTPLYPVLCNIRSPYLLQQELLLLQLSWTNELRTWNFYVCNRWWASQAWILNGVYVTSWNIACMENSSTWMLPTPKCHCVRSLSIIGMKITLTFTSKNQYFLTILMNTNCLSVPHLQLINAQLHRHYSLKWELGMCWVHYHFKLAFIKKCIAFLGDW